MHRPYRRAGSDHFVVRKALADGGYLSGNTAAPGLREPEALVGEGNPEDHSCAVGSVLPGYSVRSPADGARLGHGSPNGVVPQELSDLLRCFSAGAQGVVGAGGGFLRASAADRYGKSPAGTHGKANRRGLLCGMMAKVQLRIATWHMN